MHSDLGSYGIITILANKCEQTILFSLSVLFPPSCTRKSSKRWLLSWCDTSGNPQLAWPKSLCDAMGLGHKTNCHHDIWNIVKPWNHHDISWYIYPITIHYQQICFFSRYEAYEAFNVNLELRSPQVALTFALGFITRHITRVGVGRSSANGSWILSLAGVEVLVSRCFTFCSLAYLALFSNFSVWTLGLIGRNQVESLQHLKSLRNVPTWDSV